MPRRRNFSQMYCIFFIGPRGRLRKWRDQRLLFRGFARAATTCDVGGVTTLFLMSLRQFVPFSPFPVSSHLSLSLLPTLLPSLLLACKAPGTLQRRWSLRR